MPVKLVSRRFFTRRFSTAERHDTRLAPSSRDGDEELEKMRLNLIKCNWKSVLYGSLFGVVVLAVLMVPAAPAHAQVSDDQCLTGYVCTAGDVGLHELIVIDVLEPCTGAGDTGTVNLRISAHNNVGGFAYDIGMYIETTGGDVDGAGATCYHGYLPPPLDGTLVYPTDYGDFDNDVPDGGPYDLYRELGGTQPFFDADANSCGDLDALSEVIYEFGPVTVACVDDDTDGNVDVSVGFSNKQNPTACTGVVDAIPGTTSKCTVARINLDGFSPVPVELMSFGVE